MRKWLWLFVLPFVFWACSDKMDEHYEVPGWVKGSAWDVLSDASMNGQYSMFLEAAEKAGYRSMMTGRGIMTVMAPDNNAFSAYLKKHNYGSVADMPEDKLKKLIGFHLLYYAFSKNELENYRPEGEGAYDEGTEILDPGMYYKFRTRSQDDPDKESDPVSGKNVTVYHLDRFIPVFSHYFFSSKKIDAQRNYEYFYPASKWTGSDGFNVSEATVKDYALPANNGYVYTIDKVLEPLETIYDYMKQNPDYSTFVAMYDKFSSYNVNLDLTDKYWNTFKDTLYLHQHKDPLPSIAMEWYKYDYARLDTLAYKAYSVFAPTNTALDNFFNGFWKNSGYEDFSTLDRLIQRIFLSEFVYGGSVVFPEEIVNGTVLNSAGQKYSFDPFSLKTRQMCVNGSFYGLDEIKMPALFGSVAGPALLNKKFRYFLYALSGSGLLNSFANQKTPYTLLFPQENAFKNTDGAGTEIVLNYHPEGDQLEKQNTETGEYGAVSSSELADIVRAHTVLGQSIELKTKGKQIIPIQSTFNYWFLKDGKITCSKHFNEYLNSSLPASFDPFVTFTEIKDSKGGSWSNGRAYTYNANALTGMFTSSVNDGSEMQKRMSEANSVSLPYYYFAQLLKKANLIFRETIVGLSGQRAFMFIPTNEVLKKALQEHKIPGAENITISENGEIGSETAADINELKKYLMNYFMQASGITGIPFPGADMENGIYYSFSGRPLKYTDNGSSLSVSLDGGPAVQVSGKYGYFPFCFNDGCIQFINSLLK